MNTMNGRTEFMANGMTNGLRAGTLNSANFSDGGLPESYGNYRPPQQFSQDDLNQRAPPSYANAQSMPGFPLPKSDHPFPPQQEPLTGRPMRPQDNTSALYEPAPLPQSMLNKPRPKDLIQKALMASMGGNDQAAALHTTVIKERPTGLEPHMISIQRTGGAGGAGAGAGGAGDAGADLDQGEYEGQRDGAGLRKGHGRCTYRDGSVYEGEWDRNRRHGRGTMTYKSKSVYDGEWEDGERSGHGVMKYSGGGVGGSGGESSYEGQWLRDLKHGYGCYRFHSGAEYTGQFFEGKMHGQGTYIYADGQRYLGDFDRGLKTGFGTHYYTDGNKWDGVWVADEPHGGGMYIFDNGTKVESPFVKAGEEKPAGRGAPAAPVLRKEDKLRIILEGEQAAESAQRLAEEAAEVAAEARKLTSKILEDTAQFLGVK